MHEWYNFVFTMDIGSRVPQSYQRSTHGTETSEWLSLQDFFSLNNLLTYFHNAYPNENLKLLILCKCLMELLKEFISYHISLIFLAKRKNADITKMTQRKAQAPFCRILHWDLCCLINS